nr:thioredoxin family protein [Chitinophagales bacterium]
ELMDSTQKVLNYVIFDTANKAVNLHDVLTSEFNIINFTASWCYPCHLDKNEIKEIHDKFPQKAKIISISIDKHYKDWEKYRVKNKNPWPQYITGNGGEAEITMGLRVQGIPRYILIDKKEKEN